MAISFTPGQVISWDDLNAILAQHGSPNGAKSVVTLPPKKLTDEEIQAIYAQGGTPADQPTAVRYFMEDGSYVDAVLDQPGEQTGDPYAGSGQGSTFRIADYKPSQKYQAEQKKEEAKTEKQEDPKPPTERIHPEDPKRRQVWNPTVTNAQGTRGAWEDAGAVVQKPEDVKPRQSRVNPADPTKVQEFDPATNQWVDVGANAAGVQAADERNKPKTTIHPPINGQPGYRTVTTPQGSGQPDKVEHFGPDGQPIAQLPADKSETDPTTVKGEAVYRNGKSYTPVTVKNPQTQVTETYHVDESGARVTLPEATKPGGFNAKMPPFNPDPTKPFAGVVDYSKEVFEAVKNGTLTTAEADAIMAPARELAEAFQADVRGRVTAAAQEYSTSAAQRNQDVQHTGQRLSAAGSVFSNALSEANRMLPTIAENSPNAPGLAIGNMMLGQIMANRFGGLKDTPRVEAPPIIGQYITPPGGALAAPASAQAAIPVAAPTVAPVAPVGVPASAVAPPQAPAGYDVNQFDQGPDGTLVPREYTPGGSAPVEEGVPVGMVPASAVPTQSYGYGLDDSWMDAMGLPSAEAMEMERKRRAGFGVFA